MHRHTNYCPVCAAQAFVAVSDKEFVCQQCGYIYFQNVAAAVAAVIVCADEVLFAKRAHDPAKGLYDFPGGFVDPDECLEQALLRELKEELAWQPECLPQYLFSGFNTYVYKDVTYKTVDAFFMLTCKQKPVFTVSDDVEAVEWLRLMDVKPEQLAFDVMRESLRHVCDVMLP